MNVRKADTHHPDHIFQPLTSLLLTRERIKLDKILLDEFSGSFELPLVDNFFYEPLESCDISGFRQFLDPPEKRVPPQK